MSQHSQRAQYGPSVASIVVGALSVLAACTATMFVVSGPDGGSRMWTGAALGVALCVLLTGRTVGRVTDRAAAQDRMHRLAMRREAEVENSADQTEIRPINPRSRRRGEQTRRIIMKPAVPSDPASLRPITVPMFRTDAEREMWAAEHDIPTEVLPRHYG